MFAGLRSCAAFENVRSVSICGSEEFSGLFVGQEIFLSKAKKRKSKILSRGLMAFLCVTSWE